MGVTVTSVLALHLDLKGSTIVTDLGSPPAGATGLVVAIGRDENSNWMRWVQFGKLMLTFCGIAAEGSNARVALYYTTDFNGAQTNDLQCYNAYDDYIVGAAWLTPDTDEELYLEGYHATADTNTYTFTPDDDVAAVCMGEGTSGIAVYGSLTSMSSASDGGDHFLFGKQEGLSASTEYTVGTTPTGAGAATVARFGSRTPLALQTSVALEPFATTKNYTYALDIGAQPAGAVGLLIVNWCYAASDYVQGDMTYGGVTMNRPTRSYATDGAVEPFYLDDLSGVSGTTLGWKSGKYDINVVSGIWLLADSVSMVVSTPNPSPGSDNNTIEVNPSSTTVRTFTMVQSETICTTYPTVNPVVGTIQNSADLGVLAISDEHDGIVTFTGFTSTDPVMGAISFSATGGGGPPPATPSNTQGLVIF